MLANRVWGTEHVSENSIDVTASGLRNKLEGALPKSGSAGDNSTNGAPRPRMETVRGVGYRLELEPGGEA